MAATKEQKLAAVFTFSVTPHYFTEWTRLMRCEKKYTNLICAIHSSLGLLRGFDIMNNFIGSHLEKREDKSEVHHKNNCRCMLYILMEEIEPAETSFMAIFFLQIRFTYIRVGDVEQLTVQV